MSVRDFQILTKLGEGSFSSVWKVKRISDGQEYAMKKVKMASLSEKEKQNALNEVRILASIKNPFIVGYKEAFFEDNSMTLCVVMEYAGGGDVYNKILQHQKANIYFKEQDIWRYAIQMIIGLKVLHDMKILHRDLKCANIFLSSDGKEAKLGDLNVSKVAKNNLVYTQTGTPYYASPEVWRDQPYDMKSDIWSLGCVIYEMCALKPPFRANDMQGLYKKVQRGIFDRIPSQYSIDLYNFVSMCLQTKPSMRPSCEQLLSHPIILRNGSELIQVFDSLEENNELLGTIKLPKNIRAIGQQLPKPKYEEMRPVTELGDRGRVGYNENIKQIQPGINKRPISQNVPLTRNYNLIRESQSRESRIAYMQKVEPIAKKESDKEYLARMQRDYIDKAKVIRPLDLMKSPKGAESGAVRQKQPINNPLQNKKALEIVTRPESRVRESADLRTDLITPSSKARPKILEVKKATEDFVRGEPAGLPSHYLRPSSREKSKADLGAEKHLLERQDYLLNKYQNKDIKLDDKRVLPRISTPQNNDALIRKADYLIQKYQGIDLYKRDGISSREEVKRNAITPGNGIRNQHVDILDKYKNLYGLKDLKPVNPRSPSAVGLGVPVKRIDYQYLNQNNNLYVLRKNPSNQDHLAPVKKQTQIKVAVNKPVWWG